MSERAGGTEEEEREEGEEKASSSPWMPRGTQREVREKHGGRQAHAPVVEEEELDVLGVGDEELVEPVGQQVARVGVGPW